MDAAIAEGPVVYVDESGNSGQNLLDPEQPIFVMSAVHLDHGEIHRLADLIAGNAQEAHYTRMRRRAGGQARILALLEDSVLTPEAVRVSALHKPFMAPAKFVDLLIEPLVAKAGHDLYAQGMHVELAQLLFSMGPQACPEHWGRLMKAFVAFVWHGTRDLAVVLVDEMVAVIREAESHPVGDFVAMAPLDVDLLVEWHGRDEGEEPADALDPGLASVVEQIHTWGSRIGPFTLVFDESRLIERWAKRVLALRDPDVAAAHDVTETYRMPVLQLTDLKPANSRAEPAIQIADLVAGACAEVLRSRMAGSEPTAWQLRLREARVLRFVDHVVWPHDQAVAREFDLQGCLPED